MLYQSRITKFTTRTALGLVLIIVCSTAGLAASVEARSSATTEPQAAVQVQPNPAPSPMPESQQGRMYGEPGFLGEPINLNVVNADIRDILSYITDQYGINFVIDKSVKDVPVTVKVNDVPWNIALDSVLQAQGLGVQVNGNILRVADTKTLAEEGELFRSRMNNQLDTSPLYTEFVRLNYARASGTLSSTAGSANQLMTGTSSMVGGNDQEAARPITSSGADAGILGIVQKRLSRRGAVEVDGRSNTLIITDVRQNI